MGKCHTVSTELFWQNPEVGMKRVNTFLLLQPLRTKAWLLGRLTLVLAPNQEKAF